jgi:hypothetical protein
MSKTRFLSKDAAIRWLKDHGCIVEEKAISVPELSGLRIWGAVDFLVNKHKHYLRRARL